MPYQTKHIQRMLSVSRETVRQWTLTFADFMSDAATPEQKGHTRQYGDDDLRVLSLVAESRRAGLSNEEIRAALERGERGPVPEFGRDVLASAEQSRELARLQSEVADLRSQLADAEFERDAGKGMIRMLQIQLEQKDREIRDLNREIGALLAGRGDMD